jgi:hypothetical protein
MAESNPAPTSPLTNHVSDRLLAEDHKFNESLFKTVSYSLTGLGLGVAASLFSRNKARLILFSAGTGTGWGFHEFSKELHAHK